MAENKVVQEILEETTQEVIEEVVNEMTTEETTEAPTLLTLDEFKEKLIIKEKASIAEQKMLVQTVYDSCVKKDEENGIYYIDYIMQLVAYSFSILSYYTNYYEIVENADGYTYEYLDEIGLFDYVVSNIDTDMVWAMINNFDTRVADLNSVGCFVYRVVDKATKNMPDIKDLQKLIKSVPKVINGIDKDVLAVFAKDLKDGKVINIDKAKNTKAKK